MKDSIVKSYGKKGQKVVDMNWAAVDAGVGEFHEVKYPASWADAVDEVAEGRPTTEYFEKVAAPVLGQIGDDLKVSDFTGREDGTMPSGTAKFEKAGPALYVPSWDSENVSAVYSAPSSARMQRFAPSSLRKQNGLQLLQASRRLLRPNPVKNTATLL